jgi:hypothetical protein
MIPFVFRPKNDVGNSAAKDRAHHPEHKGPGQGHVHVHCRFRDKPRKQPNNQIPENVKHPCASKPCPRRNPDLRQTARSLPPLSEIELIISVREMKGDDQFERENRNSGRLIVCGEIAGYFLVGDDTLGTLSLSRKNGLVGSFEVVKKFFAEAQFSGFRYRQPDLLFACLGHVWQAGSLGHE